MKRPFWFPIAVGTVALAVRGAYWLEMRRYPLFSAAVGDTWEYLKDAFLIAGGRVWGGDVYFHSSPLYSYFLVPFVKTSLAAPADLSAVALAQLLISALTAVLAYDLTRRIAGPTWGLVGGALYALAAGPIFYDGELLGDFILPPVLVAVVILAGAPFISPKRGLGIGALIGIGALVRPSCLILLAPAAAFAWPYPSRGRIKSVVRVAAPAALGAIAVIAPFTIRNAVVGHDFVLISSNGGVNFWIGNNAHANGAFNVPGPWPSHLEASARAYAEKALGRRLKPSQVSAYFTRETLRYVAAHPGSYFRHVARKSRLLAAGYEIPNHMDVQFFRTQSKTLKYLPIGWGIVWPLAAAGVIIIRRNRYAAAATAFAATYLGSLVFFFFVTGRYRFPAYPLLAALAAAAPPAAAQAWRARRWAALAIAGVVTLGGIGLVLWPPPMNVRVDESYSYHHLGGVYSNLGNYKGAVRAYEKAIACNPGDAFSWNNLGLAYMRLGAYRRAEEALNQALTLTPDNADTLNNYGSLMIYQGRFGEAELWVRKALAKDGQNPYALVNLGILRLAAGDAEGALRALNAAAAVKPDYANTFFNMGLVYEATGDYRRARAAYERGLILDPNNAAARRRWQALGG